MLNRCKIDLPPLQSSVFGAIRNTPMVGLRRCVRAHGVNGRILAKLEYLNPGFSKQDRIALERILDARGNGRLWD